MGLRLKGARMKTIKLKDKPLWLCGLCKRQYNNKDAALFCYEADSKTLDFMISNIKERCLR